MILKIFTCLFLLAIPQSIFSMHILYIRHGEVPGNNANDPLTYIYTGSGTDESLTELGQKQAIQCAETLSQMPIPITALYSSPLKRAQETASPIANKLNLEIELRDNLREIYWGSADGQLVQEMTEKWGDLENQIKNQFPDRKTRWDHLPVFDGAETYNALLKRTLDEFQDIYQDHVNDTVIIVGHGRVLKTLIAEAKDSESNIPYPPNGGMAEFTYSLEEGLQLIKVY